MLHAHVRCFPRQVAYRSFSHFDWLLLSVLLFWIVCKRRHANDITGNTTYCSFSWPWAADRQCPCQCWNCPVSGLAVRMTSSAGSWTCRVGRDTTRVADWRWQCLGRQGCPFYHLEYVCTCMYVLFRSIQYQRGTIYTVWYDLKYVDQGGYLEVLLLLSQRLSPGWPIKYTVSVTFWITDITNKCHICHWP